MHTLSNIQIPVLEKSGSNSLFHCVDILELKRDFSKTKKYCQQPDKTLLSDA